MQLELKHIAARLPYGPYFQYEGILNGKEIAAWEKENSSDDIFYQPDETTKPGQILFASPTTNR